MKAGRGLNFVFGLRLPSKSPGSDLDPIRIRLGSTRASSRKLLIWPKPNTENGLRSNLDPIWIRPGSVPPACVPMHFALAESTNVVICNRDTTRIQPGSDLDPIWIRNVSSGVEMANVPPLSTVQLHMGPRPKSSFVIAEMKRGRITFTQDLAHAVSIFDLRILGVRLENDWPGDILF